MAPDSLNQIGKYIGKTGKDSTRALNRNYPIQPRLERIRDVFDEASPFEMSFETTEQDGRVLLDLFFNLPPPIRGCKVGCIHTKCEEFSYESGGDHAVTLSNPYLAGSITVFINGNALLPSQINEINPKSGEVFFKGSEDGPDTIAICYIHLDCPEESPFPKCPALGPSFIGAQLVFSDRFDRTPSITPYGGLGYWYDFDIKVPLIPATYGGSLNVLTLAKRFVFENIQGTGIMFEKLIAVDLTYLGTAANINFQFSMQGERHNSGSYISISGSNIISVRRMLSVINTSFSNTVRIQNSDVVSRPSPIDVHQKVYIRHFFDGQLHQAKIWPQNEDEPSTWIQFTDPLGVTLTSNYKDKQISGDFNIGGSVVRNGGAVYVSALQIWTGAISNVFGWYDHGGEPGTSWTKYICRTDAELQAEAAGVYFETCATHTDTLTPFDTSAEPLIEAVSHSSEIASGPKPSHSIRFAWNQFDPIEGHFVNSSQNVVSYKTELGKSQVVKISGEVRWVKGDGAKDTSGSPDLSISFDAFKYGDGTPPVINDTMIGDSLLIIQLPHNGSNHPSVSDWVYFQIEVPVYNGHVQWGVRFNEDRDTIGAQLGVALDTVFLGRVHGPAIEFRTLVTEAVGSPIGGAKPFCPEDTTFSERIPPLQDSFNGQTIDYASYDGTPSSTPKYYTSTSTSGHTWDITITGGARVEQNGSLKGLFRANGITTDGSDGRLPYLGADGFYQGTGYGNFNGLTSLTYQSIQFSSTDAPQASSSFYELSAQFMFSNPGETWEVTATPGYNSNYDFLLGDVYSPYGYLKIGNDLEAVWIFVGNEDAIPFNNENNKFYVWGMSGINSNKAFPVIIARNVLYNFYIEYTEEIKFKIWRADEPIPSSWLMEGDRASVYNSDGTKILMSYNEFIDDNFTIEVSNVLVNPIQPFTVIDPIPPPPIYTPPPVFGDPPTGTQPIFLTRPSSAPLIINNQNDFTITNLSFQGGGGDVAIKLTNCKRVTISNCDFADWSGGVYATGCEDIVFEFNRTRNIGNGSPIGSGNGNVIQLATSRGGAIRYNRCLGGRSEDMLSIWHSGGWGVGNELIVEYNQLQGLVSDISNAKAWTSNSGTGMILSDGGGHPYNGHIIARYNKLLTPGQVGIQFIDGPNLQAYGNIIYGEKRVSNNNPMTTWEGTPVGLAYDNVYWWTNNDGSHPNPWKHPGGGGMNFYNNIADSSIDPNTLRVYL